MSTRRFFAIAAFAAAAFATLAAGPAAAQVADTESSALPVPLYTVFVDPPTGFVFVKLPAGWKFVGKVSEEAVAQLPGTVVTALLKSEGAPLVARRDAPAAALR